MLDLELVLRGRGVVIALAPEGVHERFALFLRGQRQEHPLLAIGDDVDHLFGKPDAVTFRKSRDLFLFAQLFLRCHGAGPRRPGQQDRRERQRGPETLGSHNRIMVVPAKPARKTPA